MARRFIRTVRGAEVVGAVVAVVVLAIGAAPSTRAGARCSDLRLCRFRFRLPLHRHAASVCNFHPFAPCPKLGLVPLGGTGLAMDCREAARSARTVGCGLPDAGVFSTPIAPSRRHIRGNGNRKLREGGSSARRPAIGGQLPRCWPLRATHQVFITRRHTRSTVYNAGTWF